MPVLEFFQDPSVQEKVEEVGRIIWSNGSISINLGAVLALGTLGLIGLGLLLSVLFGSSGGSDTGGGGYGYGYSGASGSGDYYSAGDYVQKRVSYRFYSLCFRLYIIRFNFPHFIVDFNFKFLNLIWKSMDCFNSVLSIASWTWKFCIFWLVKILL